VRCPLCVIDFCFWCGKLWKGKSDCGNAGCMEDPTNTILAGANLITTTKFPVQMYDIRMCPRKGCFGMVAYKEGCKHYPCPNCREYFCGRCMAPAPYPASCGAVDFKCPLAPKQKV